MRLLTIIAGVVLAFLLGLSVGYITLQWDRESRRSQIGTREFSYEEHTIIKQDGRVIQETHQEYQAISQIPAQTSTF